MVPNAYQYIFNIENYYCLSYILENVKACGSELTW